HSEALEWISWTLALIDQHADRLRDLVMAPTAGRRDHAAVHTESWRQRASHSDTATALLCRLEHLAQQADRYMREMDFSFLYDETRALFSIGYRPVTQTRDESYYDLLASEARLASFVAVAKGD